jgi:hypothetical protein
MVVFLGGLFVVKKSDEELACDFTAIPEDEREAHRTVARNLFESIEDVKERPQGYSFRIPGNSEAIERAGAFMARERLCCPFFNFDLTIESGGDPVWLSLSGTDQVKTFIEETVLQEWEF